MRFDILKVTSEAARITDEVHVGFFIRYLGEEKNKVCIDFVCIGWILCLLM